MFPSSNSSSSTRDNFHYSQSPLISWCINNNCKRRDATRRAGADKVAVTRGGTLTQTAAASHHLPLCRQQRNFSGKRTRSPASRKTRENGKVCNFEGITNKNPSLTTEENTRTSQSLGTRFVIDFPAIESRNAEKLSISQRLQHASPNWRFASRQIPLMD